MNTNQRRLTIGTAAAIVAMGLFPPYLVPAVNGRILMSGWGFLFKLPVYLSETSFTVFQPVVDVTTLAVQIVVTLIAFALTFAALGRK